MKKFLLILIINSALLILHSISFAQNKNIDSLLTLLKKDKPDTNKVIHLYQLTRECQLIGDYEKGLSYGTQALGLANKLEFKKGISQSYNNMGNIYRLQSNYYRALNYFLKALRIDEKLGDKNGIAGKLNNIGLVCTDQGGYQKALEYFFKALKINEETGNENWKAINLGNIGNVYKNQADYPRALEYYFKALKMTEQQGDNNGTARHLGNIGTVYKIQADYPKALNYYFKALKLSEKQGDKVGIGRHLGNIGTVYNSQNDHPKALDYYFRALKIAEDQGNNNGIAINLGNIGNVLQEQADYPKALDYYFKSLKMAEALGYKSGISIQLSNIGSVYSSTGKFIEAEQYLKRAIALSNSTGAMDYLSNYEISLSQLYDTTRQYKLALIHYKKAIAIKDTLFSQENKKQLVRKEMNFEFDKKEAATKAEHDKEMAVAEAEKKKQQFILILVSCFLCLVFLFAGFIFRSLRITRKQKKIIELQKNEVLRQKEIVDKQKEKIVDSITYAQRIQQSILMEESEIQNYLPQSFIYFQPKDIVSGDFYWCSNIEGKIIIAAVDCTGHGVPGAFMSMIGNTLLNQIVNEKHITKPSEILQLLNLGVYEALHQKKEDALSDDGMDIALCCIDYKNNEIQYAGAQNPLYVIEGNQIEVIKAEIHGIGGGGMMAKIHNPIKKEFTNHIIPIKKDMSIYLFTDGYRDQFGGPDNKKFGTQKFKELLLKIQHLGLHYQKKTLAIAHKDWKGSTPQIDDVLVMGIKL